MRKLTRKYENHASLHGGAHACKATICGKDILVSKGRLLGLAVGIGDRVASDTLDSADAVRDDFAVLNIESSNL